MKTVERVYAALRKTRGSQYMDHIRLRQLAEIAEGPEWERAEDVPAMRKVLAEMLHEHQKAHARYVQDSQEHVKAIITLLAETEG